jgi:hypothetical protein
MFEPPIEFYLQFGYMPHPASLTCGGNVARMQKSAPSKLLPMLPIAAYNNGMHHRPITKPDNQSSKPKKPHA